MFFSCGDFNDFPVLTQDFYVIYGMTLSMVSVPTVYVTGHEGYLGNLASLHLRASGIKVVHDKTRAPLDDPNMLLESFRTNKVTHVLHTAGPSPLKSWSQHDLDWKLLAATENLANASKHCGIRRIVFLSPIQGTGTHLNETDADKQTARSPFHKAFKQCEELLQSAVYGVQGLDVSILRIAPVLGKKNRSWINRLRQRTLSRPFALKPSEQWFHFLAELDLCKAVNAALTSKATMHVPIHVGSDEFISTRDAYAQIVKALQAPEIRMAMPWSHTNPVYMNPVHLNIERAQRLLNHTPSSLETLLQGLAP